MADPFGRIAVTHAGHAGDIVRGLATQGRQIGVLLRGDVVLLLHRLRGHMLEVFEMVARVQDSDRIVHELECIAVAGEHEGAVLFAFTHGRQGADDVIAFKPGLFDVGDTERGEHLLNQRQL